MSLPQIIETPGGERLAVIPLSDYERLIAATEDLKDTRAYDEAKRRLASGDDELIPAAFAERLLGGESPVRVYRELRGLTATAVADAAGLSASYVSQIETGQREGSLSTMKAIAEALGVTLDDLA